MAYSATIPAFMQRTSADGLTVVNTIILNSTGNKNPVSLAKEAKGGLHLVEYLEYLGENSYRGVTIGRREVGMLAYVQKEWKSGADVALGKYYSLKAVAGNGDATWEELSLGGNTLTPNKTYPVATIAARNALTGLVVGDLVIVADASGDTTVVPALQGGATYVYTGTTGALWLRFLYPEDPRLKDIHKQNTDTALKVVKGSNEFVLQSLSVYDHINDESIHFKINDSNAQGSLKEVYSSAKMRTEFLAKKADGDTKKFFNERGEAVTIDIDLKITRINGGTPATKFV